MAKPINSTHAFLKESTAQAHAQLDTSARMQALIKPNLTASEYANTLAIMQAWFSDIEGYIHAHLVPDARIAHVIQKSVLIERDLAVLAQDTLNYKSTGLETTKPMAKPSSAHIPISAHMPRESSFVLGCLYVVEGSTLGGQVIAPRVQKALNIDNVTSFYECYGQDKYVFFARVMDYIQSHVPKNKHSVLKEGALFAFMNLHKHLN